MKNRSAARDRRKKGRIRMRYITSSAAILRANRVYPPRRVWAASCLYYRRFFDPEKFNIVLHDQRGCGNTTWDLRAASHYRYLCGTETASGIHI